MLLLIAAAVMNRIGCLPGWLGGCREEFIMSRLKVNLRRFRLMAAGFSNFSRWWAGIEVSQSSCV